MTQSLSKSNLALDRMDCTYSSANRAEESETSTDHMVCMLICIFRLAIVTLYNNITLSGGNTTVPLNTCRVTVYAVHCHFQDRATQRLHFVQK